MHMWQPGDEDTLSFEATDIGGDPKNNVYFTLDEHNPEQALRLRFGTAETTLAADEALILLDWLGEREALLFALLQLQPTVAASPREEGKQ